MVRALSALLGAAGVLSAQSFHVYIGSSGKGIYQSEFDAKSGTLTAASLAADTAAPSFLTIHSNGRFLYAVNEVADGRVSGFTIEHGSGKLTPINSASVKSSGPCHL